MTIEELAQMTENLAAMAEASGMPPQALSDPARRDPGTPRGSDQDQRTQDTDTS